MPADLFRSASSYAPVKRRASILPVSVAAHVMAIAAAFTVPLLGDIDFPPPNHPPNFAYTDVVLPPPPPVRLLRPPPSGARSSPLAGWSASRRSIRRPRRRRASRAKSS